MEVAYTTPIIVGSNKIININLDELNQMLWPCKIRVDSLQDIYIDAELSKINEGDVLVINAVYVNPDDSFDPDIFFNRYKDLEDSLEALDGVYSAEMDRANLVLTIVMATKGNTLKKTLQSGGSLEFKAEEELKNNAGEVFRITGIAPPENEEQIQDKFEAAKLALVEKYKQDQPVEPKQKTCFYLGQKININDPSSAGYQFLQTQVTKQIYDKLGENLTEENPAYQSHFANAKAIIAMDILNGMVSRSTDLIYRLDSLDEIINQAQAF